MALITTTGTVIRQYNAFTGLSAQERSQSGIARAEVVYYNVNDTWAAPGSGNNRLYQSGVTDLPKDFGYVLTDAYLQVKGENTVAVYTEAAAELQIRVGGTLGPFINLTLPSEASRQNESGTTAVGSIAAGRYNTINPSLGGNDGVINYSLVNKPTTLIYPFGSNAYTTTPNPASQFNIGVAEALSNGSAYKVSLYLRFLQYDIDQSYNYVVQSPQLTR